MKAVSGSLAGRAELLELDTLSWAEAHRATPDLTVERFLVRGGFPELHEKPELDASGLYRSYVTTYLERDLRQLLHVGNLHDFERFVRACALRSAQLLNRADLAQDVGISGSTAAAWLGVLDASGQIALLDPWFGNRTKSLITSPKLYLRDTGLCSFLVGLRDASDLEGSPLVGALWETLVFGELWRMQQARTGGWALHFWRDRSKEADSLRHRAGRFELADAKWTELPGERYVDSLRRVREAMAGQPVDSMSIICRAAHPFPLGTDAQALPLSAFPEHWAT